MADIRELKTDFQRTFGSPTGGRVLTNLLRETFTHESEWDPDARRHAFNSGKRALGLHIIALLEYTPEEVANVIRGRPPFKLNEEE